MLNLEMASSKWYWTELDSVPHAYFAKLLSVNDHEFICIPSRSSDDNNRDGKNSDGIYVYNSIHNKWCKIINYPTNFETLRHSTTIDKKNQIIYIANGISKLYKIDLKTKTIELLSNNVNVGAFPGIILIKNKIHIIGARENYKHFLYDQDDDQLKEICDFADNDLMTSRSSIYLKSTQSAFTTVYYKDNPLDPVSIMEFKDNEWSDLNIKDCDGLHQSCILSTFHEDYLLIIGGVTDITFWIHANIFVYNIKNKKLMKSDIRSPFIGYPFGAITKNDENDELLTFGFIRNCYKIFSLFNDVQIMPFYLMKFIQKWVCNEKLHLMLSKEYDNKIKTHWMINVDRIIGAALNREARLERDREERKRIMSEMNKYIIYLSFNVGINKHKYYNNFDIFFVVMTILLTIFLYNLLCLNIPK